MKLKFFVLLFLTSLSFLANAKEDKCPEGCNNTCTGGGTLYVCGSEQMRDAFADAEKCDNFAKKSITDVCSPGNPTWTITP